MDERAQRHQQRMQVKKQLIDQRIAAAHLTRGVLLVHTGNGKGKSSSALGMVLRALGHDLRVAYLQFIKGAKESGEARFLRRFPEQVHFHTLGEGYTWETQDRSRDCATCARAWEVAQRYLRDPDFDLVVLDELNIALKYDYLPLEQVLADLAARPALQHVVVTGRGAPPALLEKADTVTEMRALKHAYAAGIGAQVGIEW